MDFIANDGSYAHRGVWHVTDNLTKTETPERVDERNYGWGDIVSHYEATVTYTGDAICGQKNKMKEGGHHWSVKMKDQGDGKRHYLYRAKRPNVVIGLQGYIPGPLCSRCAKKAGIEF